MSLRFITSFWDCTRILLILFLTFRLEKISCLEKRFVKIHSHGSLPCQHNVASFEFLRVKWFKSSRDDIFENGDPAVVSWDNISQPYTEENYGIDREFSLLIYNTTDGNRGIFSCYVTLKTDEDTHKHEVKLITYDEVNYGPPSTVEREKNFRLPCDHNVTAAAEVDISGVLWYKGMARNFAGDQAIASWEKGEKHSVENYILNDDFSLGIRNVSLKHEAVYRCIVIATDESKTWAKETQVIVYVLPQGIPQLNVSTITDTTFVNCSVNHVYPLLYPEFEFHHETEYSVQNDDGTYNTSISGIVPDNLHNGTVECHFCHFNYTSSSAHEISDDENTPHPSESTVTSRVGVTVGVILGSLFLVLFLLLLLVAAVLLWKRSTKKNRQNDVDIKPPEIEHMI